MDAFAAAGLADPGVTTIPLPTPFPVGRVNAYLLDGDAPVLIDTGPRSERTYDALVAALAAVGRRVADLRTILLTHAHMDHAGLAGRLRAESGARLVCLAGMETVVEHFEEEWEENEAHLLATFPDLGMPAEVVETIVAVSRPYARFGGSATVDAFAREGDVYSSGAVAVRALHTPGHTPWCTTWVHDSGFAFSGDFLLKRITSNPVLQRPDEKTGARTRPLVQFLASLARMEREPLALVLPGHGDAVDDPGEVVRRAVRHHRRRLERIRAAVSATPLTPYEIVAKLFRNLPIAESFLAISEVMAHLELLEDEGAIVREEGRPARFRATA
jgi:glyoxylase-like metal-dependent hydrolase (beta-lactamase superfamily II)